MAYRLPVRLRSLSTAEVAEGPGSISEHAQLAAVAQKAEERRQSSSRQDVVAALGRVSSNVTQSPNSLLSHIGLVARKQFDEDRNCAGFDDDLGLCSGTRGDVGESPSSLELDKGVGRA